MTAFLARLGAALIGLIKPLLAFIIYMQGKKAGAAQEETDRLREEQEHILAGKEARREAENSDKPDPYLRD